MSRNRHVDSLATLAAFLDDSIPCMITMELLKQLNFKQQIAIMATLELGPSLLDPFVAYLSDGSLSNNIKEADKVHRTAARFLLFEDGRLYKQSFEGPYLLCLHPSKSTELLAELYKGICGGHSGGRSLAHCAMIQGF